MLLVTLDDIGCCRAVNSAVLRCLEHGSAGCLSLMATGGALDEAIEVASSFDVRIAVHLNSIEPPFITDADFPDSVRGWLGRSSSLREVVRKEWSAQIELILSSGLMVTRLDSHRHIHMLPALGEVVLDLAEEYGIGSIRSTILPDRWRRPSGPFLDRLGRSFSRLAFRRGIGTNRMMLGFSRSGSVSREYLVRYGNAAGDEGETELVMHPSETPVWSEGQQEELSLLTSVWFTEWLEGR